MKTLMLSLLIFSTSALALTQQEVIYMLNWQYTHPSSAKYDDAYNAARSAVKLPAEKFQHDTFTVYCVDKCGFKNLKRNGRKFKVKP